MRAYERLIRYAKVHTASSEDLSRTPSTGRQFDLAHLLEKELKTLGLSDVYADDHCYVYANIPARIFFREVVMIALFGIISPLLASWAASKNVLKMTVAEVLHNE